MTARDRAMLMVALVALVVGGFWFALLGPRRQQASDASAQVATARSELDQARRLASGAQALTGRLAADAALLARLGKALPADDQTASLIYQLQDAAGRSNVRFNSIQPSGANGAPAGNAQGAQAPASGAAATPGAAPGPVGISQMPLSLVFDGRYGDLERFLRRVQAFTTVRGDTVRVSGRLLSVQSIDLAAAPDGFPHIRATITATAYIAAPSAAAPPSAGAAPAGQTAGAPASSPPTVPATIGAGR